MVMTQITTLVGSFASLFGLFYMLWPNREDLIPLHGMFWWLGICLFVATIVWLVLNYKRNKPKTMTKESQILKYMYKWISKGGRVAILSRDMTWAGNKDMKELLDRKAENSELCLFLPKQIPLSQELETHGAQVFVYPELNYVPESRFTIRNWGRMAEQQVAVGRRQGEKHVIEEYSAGQHPVFWVTDDLINILKIFCELKGQPDRK